MFIKKSQYFFLLYITIFYLCETIYAMNFLKKNNNTISRGVQLDSEYDLYYPYYYKYCSTTKFHPQRGKGIPGGIAGHAVFYLKGVCIDPNIRPLGIKMCDKNQDLKNPNTGVGISVDRWLSNTSFFVIPSLDIFIGGKLDNIENFDSHKKQAIVQKALDMGLFDNIQFHEEAYPNSLLKEDRKEFIANYSFGTDYALSMARNLYCINIPTKKEIMQKIVTWLNKRNIDYRNSQGKPFRGFFCRSKKKDNKFYWNGISDNCAHPVVNSLASIGILKKKKINQIFLNN